MTPLNNSNYTHLKTRIKALESEYSQLKAQPNRSLEIMLRMEHIEQLLPYLRLK